MRKSHWYLRIAGALGIGLSGGMLQAAPIISIDSPPPGDLYDLRPTITISYSSDNPPTPLNLSTLLIMVNGADWTAKFTQTATQAVYAVTAQDQFIAGEVTIAASVWDTAQPPVQASASRTYAVFPTFEAISPDIGREGTQLTLTVQGLDPDPTKNKAVFRGAFGPEVEIAFETVDLPTSHGTVSIPDYAATGPVFAEVNGRRSAASLPVTVLSEFPTCSNYWQTEDILWMSDGGMLVNYDSYNPTDPNCPAIPAGFRDPVVVRMRPDGGIDMVGTSWSSVPPAPTKHQNLIAMALDKTGLEPVRVYEEFSTPGVPFTPFVIYKGIKSHFGTGLHPWDADFDGDGNLYLIVSNTKVKDAPNRIIQLLRIPAAALAAGGTVVPEVVADNLQTETACGVRGKLRVSCDGSAHLALQGCYDEQIPGQGVFSGAALLKIQDGQVVTNIGVTDGQLHDLAVTCAGEVYGTKLMDPYFEPGNEHNQVWRSVDGGPLQKVVPLQDSVAAEKLTVSLAGKIYISYYVPAERAILKVPYQASTCELVIEQDFCSVPPLMVLPATTRWRPQKNTSEASAPIEIIFRGPSDLTDTTAWPSVTAEIKDPNGAAVPTPNLVFSVVNQPANEYKLTWSGPWLTNQGDPASYLPRGNYDVVVKATKADDTVVASAHYDKVSLVEVKTVALVGLAGGAPLNANPGPAAGTRIFSEAQEVPTSGNQNPDALDTVSVVATVEPPIPDPGAQPPLSVYFRALDVDDPSANAPPVDDESTPCVAAGCDNRGTPQTGSFADGTNWPEGRVGVQVSTTTAQASAIFKTSIRQGDNYRLAASTSDVWLNGLNPETTQPPEPQMGTVVHTSGESLTPGVQVSDMLTAWRTLHLEVDALVSQDPPADQAAMDLRGTTFNNLNATTLTVTSGPFFTQEHPTQNGWAGANLSMAFHTSDWYDVATNTATQMSVNVGAGQPPLHNNLSRAALVALPDKSWIVRDDEVSSLDASSPCGTTSCAADYTLAHDLFAKAYIEVYSIVQPGTDATIPFVLTSHRYITSNLELPNQTLSSRTYWATQLASAYDGNAEKDFDPRPSPSETYKIGLGLTTVGYPVNDGRYKLKSTIFFETIRDLYEKPPTGTVGGEPLVLSPEVNKRVTAHEMLHTFGIGHDAKIMCAEINIQDNTIGGEVTDDHIEWLRAAEWPVFPPEQNDECP